MMKSFSLSWFQKIKIKTTFSFFFLFFFSFFLIPFFSSGCCLVAFLLSHYLCFCCYCQCVWLCLQFGLPLLAPTSLLLPPLRANKFRATNGNPTNGWPRRSLCRLACFPSPPLIGLSSWCSFPPSHIAILQILNFGCVIRVTGVRLWEAQQAQQALAPPSTMAFRFMTIRHTNRE